VSYTLNYSAAIKVQIRNLQGLSREGRVKLFANLHWGLAVVSDPFRNNPANRNSANPAEFDFQLLLFDNRVRTFLFRVDDSGAGYGVLQLVSVVDLTPPTP
jgi:hypothetical protein